MNRMRRLLKHEWNGKPEECKLHSREAEPQWRETVVLKAFI